MPINTPTGYLDITNATLRGSKIVTTGFVGIANANPTNHLSVGSNLHINDTHSNVLQISGNINAASVVLGGISIAPTFDLEIVTNTGNTTPYTVEFNNTATAFVTTANATIGDTLTASKLVGDGSGISAIQSSNVTDFASNVSRITALETDLGNNSARITNLSSNLSDNSARITNLSSNLSDNSVRITNLSSNLSDNSSRITTLESGDISISGDKTFTGDIVFESNVHMNGGNVLVANTVNLTVSDPIIELGSNNIGANDLGIIMTRPNNNSNVAVVFDESVDILRMGYTLNGANDTIVDLDSNALAVSVQGALSAASVSGDGSGLTSLNASNITTGALSTTSVTIDDYLIHDGDTDTKVGFPLADTFTVTTANSERLRVDSSGNVGIGTDSPAYTLDVHGTANVGALYSTLTYSNASANIVAWNSSTNEIIDSGLEKGFTEHPLVPMTDYNTYVEGHGTYEASASSEYSSTDVYDIFNYSTSSVDWLSATAAYNASSGIYEGSYFTTDVGGTRYTGEYVQLKLPYGILLSHSNVMPWDVQRAPADGVILGSNDGEAWYKLTEFSGESYTSSTWKKLDVNATTPYTHYRLVFSKVGTGQHASITEWRLFAEKDVTKMENLHISGDLSSETLQTGYIKWPRKPLKANESEGYVASASNVYNTDISTQPFAAFNDIREYLFNGYGPSFVGGNGDFTSGVANKSRTTGDDTFNHEWLQIQLPRAIQLSHFTLLQRLKNLDNDTDMPKNGRMYGSNDGVTWTKLITFSDLTYERYEETRVDVKSATPYSYYRLAVTDTVGSSQVFVAVGELQLFEAATGVGGAPTSAKLQVHGSLGLAKGSSLYAGDSVVAEFPKHDRPLTKYPEVAMTANSSGGYVASASSSYDTSGSYSPWLTFDGEPVGAYQWISGGNPDTYDTSTGVATSADSLNGQNGSYVTLELPKAIKPHYVKLYHRTPSHSNPRAPKSGYVYGSNDNSSWTQIGSFSYSTLTGGDSEYKYIQLDSNNKKYKYLAFQVTSVFASGSTYDAVAIRELEYYGTEEGDESVDVVHRSVPNKPGTQHLEVYWDANDSNSYSFADSDAVYDLSGNGVTGTITGTNGFDSEYNAWVFDGSGDYVSTTLNTTTGAWVHSFSFWINADTAGAGHFVALGTEGTNGVSVIRFNNQDIFQWYFWGNDLRFNAPGTVGRWIHVVGTYDGGNDSGVSVGNYGVSRKIFINGKEATVSENVSSTAGTNPLNLTTTTTPFRIGAQLSGGAGFDGKIANVRIFSKKLLVDQIRELYEYDAERFGHRTNVVALHKGNLGVGVTHPTSRFEVAGADGLQEYPPRVISVFDYHTYIEDHGVFDFYSNQNNPTYFNSSTWNFTRMFKNTTTSDSGWHGGVNGMTSPGMYQAVAVYAPAVTSGDGLVESKLKDGSVVRGEWVEMHTPYGINVTSIVTAPRQNYGKARGIGKFVILGSNTGTNWEYAGSGAIAPHDNSSSTDAGGYGTKNSETPAHVSTNSNGYYYTYHRLVVTHIMGSRADSTHPDYSATASESVNQSYLRFYGTPAPSSLEDGHLTLGKTLTTPRVSGHPAGAETPRAESLVVHYDTTVDSVKSGTTVVDTSGNGLNGTFNGNAAYSSSERALVFDGNGDSITTTAPFSAGDNTFSVSFWVKRAANGTTYCPFYLGDAANGQRYRYGHLHNWFSVLVRIQW